jgi:conjugative relaxase-like TrwC/TraI family protein
MSNKTGRICIQMLSSRNAARIRPELRGGLGRRRVLSVAKLAPGQEAYYEASVARGLDDYYAGRGESPGSWVGVAAAELGLVGVVGDGALRTLMRGEDPVSGARLRPPVAVRTIRVERLDPATGERRLVERELRPVAGFDLVFSTPKSVSLLHALGDEQVRVQVAAAHEAAWRAALGYVEREACVIRKGRNGAERERGSGFAAAAFQHRTSRAGDPHLHTHVIVANAAHSDDGVWRALDGDLLLRAHRLAAGYLYEAQLRYELTTRLGVAWRPVRDGMAELAGVPDAVVREFSTRRRQILEHHAEVGETGWRAAQVAAIATRDRKQWVDMEMARRNWAARAAEHGLGQRDLRGLLGRHAWRRPSGADCRGIAQVLLSAEGLTASRTRFAETDAIQAWCNALRDGAPAERIVATARAFTRLDGIVSADDAPPSLGVAAHFTTRELVAVEQHALRLARGVVEREAVVDPARVERVLAQRAAALSGEQRRMISQLATAGERVTCVIGPAGSGKTTALAALHEVLVDAGVPVVGAAPSGIAAATLQAATGIPSRTLHRLLVDAERGEALPRGCVLVVDEAGMADTRTLGRILEHAQKVEGRVVLVGDPRQLGAVGPGGLYTALCSELGATELAANQRQHDPAECNALQALRDGDPDTYLAWAACAGRLVVCDAPLGARAALLADWASHTLQDPAGEALMLAYTRRDVAALNAAARELLQRRGILHRDTYRTPTGLGLARGDRVICLKNDQALRVTNGTRGTIIAIGRNDVLIRTTERAYRALPRSYVDAGQITHAYAVTGHKSQGQTVDHAYVLAPARAELAEWGYVSTSRARTSTRIYLAAPDPADDHRAAFEPPEAVEQLAAALTRQANDELASRGYPANLHPLTRDRGLERDGPGLGR